MIRSIFYILICIFISFSCKKYEEGPLVSFRTKNKRIQGSYNINEFKVNGEDKLIELQSSGADGTYEFLIVDGDNYIINKYIKGMDPIRSTWRWGEKKEYIAFGPKHTPTYGVIGYSATWTILKLTDKEMKLHSNFIDDKSYIVNFKKIK